MVRCTGMWNWRRNRTALEGFPQGFKVQRIGTAAAKDISDLPPPKLRSTFVNILKSPRTYWTNPMTNDLRRPLSSKRRTMDSGLVGLREE
jgi:hypothetical protein